jgi:hypothetical protein
VGVDLHHDLWRSNWQVTAKEEATFVGANTDLLPFDKVHLMLSGLIGYYSM